MKIDEKTLSILGAPKEGFEWEKVEGTGMCPKPGDAVEYVDGKEMMKYPGHDAAPFRKGQFFGACRVRGYLYRQVPVEPPVEVIRIWLASAEGENDFRILANGTGQYRETGARFGTGRWYDPGFSKQAKDFHADYAQLFARAKKAEDQLREIKDATNGARTPDQLRQDGWHTTAYLVKLCRAIEVPTC